jgi:cytochrome c
MQVSWRSRPGVSAGRLSDCFYCVARRLSRTGSRERPVMVAVGRVTCPSQPPYIDVRTLAANPTRHLAHGNDGMSSILRLCVLALLFLAPPPAFAQQGNPAEGAEVFKACRPCHHVGAGAKNALGPVLNGIIGRKAGTIEGFNYSPVNIKAGEDGWTWTEENLDKYLRDPRGAMPGNRMAFVGVKDDQDRRDLIAYLKTLK